MDEPGPWDLTHAQFKRIERGDPLEDVVQPWLPIGRVHEIVVTAEANWDGYDLRHLP